MSEMKVREPLVPQPPKESEAEESTETSDEEQGQWKMVLDKGRASQARKVEQRLKKAKERARKAGKSQLGKPPGRTVGPRTPTGGGIDDEIDRLVRMLRRMQKLLGDLTSIGETKLTSELSGPISSALPEINDNFGKMISTLLDKKQHSVLRPQLENAGLVGNMLETKETSLNYHMDRADRAILTYNTDPTFFEKLIHRVKPALKITNSILGSLKIPGSEIVKEYKEHVEAAYESLETEQD